MNNIKDFQLVANYLTAYERCDGSIQAQGAIFEQISPSDYRALRAKLWAVGIGLPEKSVLVNTFNGSSAQVFFKHLCFGARRLGVNHGQGFPAPQQR